jgi:hypothetical protein
MFKSLSCSPKQKMVDNDDTLVSNKPVWGDLIKGHRALIHTTICYPFKRELRKTSEKKIRTSHTNESG